MMTKTNLFLFSLIISFSLASHATEPDLNQNVNMVMQVIKTSSQFHDGMACAGVSEDKKTAYLEMFEKGYRECLEIHPQSEDGGAPFLACFSPKAKTAFESIGVSQSKMKECGFEEE